MTGLGSKGRITVIEGLRFAAAVVVVIHHYFHVGGWGRLTNVYFAPPIDQIARYGYLGVDLFFIISGFVIFFSLRNNSWFDFAIKRYFRLAPSLIAGAIITFVAVNFIFRDPLLHRPVSSLICSTLLPLPVCELPRFGYVDPAYWSLTTEMIFYALVAAMLALGLTREDRWIRGVFWGWCAASAIALLPAFESGALFFLKYALGLKYAGYFVGGAAMYKVWSGVKSYWPVMLTGLVLAAAHAAEHAIRLSSIRGTFYSPVIAVVIVAALSGVMIGVATGKFQAESRWLATLGALTYPLYLLHEYIGFAAINWLTAHGVGKVVAALMAFAVTLAMAQGMVMTTERLSRSLSRWYTARFQQPRGTVQ